MLDIIIENYKLVTIYIMDVIIFRSTLALGIEFANLKQFSNMVLYNVIHTVA